MEKKIFYQYIILPHLIHWLLSSAFNINSSEFIRIRGVCGDHRQGRRGVYYGIWVIGRVIGGHFSGSGRGACDYCVVCSTVVDSEIQKIIKNMIVIAKSYLYKKTKTTS